MTNAKAIRAITVLTMCAGGVLSGWTAQRDSAANDQLDPRIPSARPRQYEAVLVAKDWRNPYLVIGPDSIELIAIGLPSRRTTVASTDLQRTLASLPVTAWPYGRVVAVQEDSIRVPERDDKPIADNLNATLAILKRLQVRVERWPG